MNTSHELAFLDTVGLIAVWNDSDQWHNPAQQAYASLRKNKAVLVTTSYVLLECGNAAARQSIRDDVIALKAKLTTANRLILPSEDDWNQAWEAYSHRDAGDAGIVDHVSFVVMRRLGIRRAFTNDWHFTAAGFEIMF
jgi:predicted nucleic acid-binding protein